MTTQSVRVRLVPKNRQRERTHLLEEITPFRVERSSLGQTLAQHSLGQALQLNIQANLSSSLAIDGLISIDDLRKTFRCELEEVSTETSTNDEINLFSHRTETYLKPRGELQIPEELADLIDFAYIPTPPEFFGIQTVPPNASIYHLRLEDLARVLGAYRCHRLGWTGRNIRIAMADTGFAPHPYFEDYGFALQRINTSLTQDPGIDENGHGTGECANLLVIAPDCSFFGIKHDDYSALALETCLDQQPQIITNSWGWNIDHLSQNELQKKDPNQYNELRDVARIIADAVANGITVIFAGGNGQKPFPACLPYVIAAGGVTVEPDGSLKASSYASSFVSQLYPKRRVPDFCGVVGEGKTSSPLKGHLMLPVPNGAKLEGENMTQQMRNRGWGIFSGTSAAAPQIAGIIALMLSVNPKLKPTEIKSILSATAKDVSQGSSFHEETADVGIDLATGAGLVNGLAACLRVQQLLPR